MNRYFYNRSDFEDDDEILLITAQRLIEGALFICVFLLILVIMQNRDLVDQVEVQKATAEHHKTEAAKYSGFLAECMNGGAVFDRTTDTAYFCDKPTEVRL